MSPSPFDTLLQQVKNKLSSATQFIKSNPTPNAYVSQQFQNNVAQPIAKGLQGAGQSYVSAIPAAIKLSPPAQLATSFQNYQTNANPYQNAVNQLGNVAKASPLVFGASGGANLIKQGAIGAAKTILPSALLGGGINKAMGGSFLEGVGSGIGSAPQIAGVTSLTNPLISNTVGRYLGNVKNPVVGNIASRVGTGLLNIPEGAVINSALGKPYYSLMDAGMDFASGALFGGSRPNAKGFDVGRNKYSKWEPKDIEELDAIKDFIFRNKQMTKDQIEEADRVITSLARGYLPIDKIETIVGQYGKNSRGLLKAITKELDKTVKSQMDSGMIQMGIYGGKSATGFKNEGSFSSMADKKVRFEIDDSGAKVITLSQALDKLPYQEKLKRLGSGQGVTLEEILDHKKLYEAYPEIKGLKVKTAGLQAFAPGTRASYDPSAKTITIDDNLLNRQATDADKSTLLHEIQHAIQEKEGFARGGSPDNNAGWDLKALKEKNDAIAERMKAIIAKKADDENISLSEAGKLVINDPQYKVAWDNLTKLQKAISEASNPYKTYQRLSGEVEARDVQSRMNLTPEQRASTLPYQSQNIPVKDQIVRFEGGVSASKPSTGGDQLTNAKYILQNNTFKDFEIKGLLGLDPKYVEPSGIPAKVWRQAAKELGLTEKSFVEGTTGNFHIQPSTGIEIERKAKFKQPIKVPEQPRGFTESVQQAENIPKRVKGMVQSVYVSKPNSKLMGEAQALLQEGASLDITKVQNVDQKIAATIQEAINQQRKNPDLAANLYNNLARQGTELGRGVQAYSLLQKMTPEAIAKSAAGKIQEYNRTAVRKIPELTGDQLKLITAKVDALKKLPLGSRERNIAVNELSNTVNQFIPSSLADKAITVWKAGLLTSLRTTERNIFGNTVHGAAEAIKDLPATMADMLMSMATGKRTITPTTKGVSEAWSKKTAQQISDTIKLGYDATEDISKYDIKRVNWGNTPIQQALKKYTDIVFRSLGAQDKPFYNAAFKRSLFSQAGAEAINVGRGGDRSFIQHLVNNPTENMVKLAMSDANVATFKDKNSASVVANAIKRELEKVKIGEFEVGKIASEVTMPFTGVPSAILGQIVNYSPIGLLKGIVNTGKVIASQVPDLQRQAAQEIGRGVIGTGIFGLGSYLASKGLITGQPKDAEEQRQWDLENKPRNSIMIGGKWRSLNSIGPEAVVFLAGAKLNEEMQNPEGSVGGYAGTLAKDYLDQSFVQGLQQPVNVITDPARYGKGYAGGMVSSVVPNIVKDLAKATDTSQRETNTIGDYAKAAIPGVRNTLIEKRDVLGNVMKQEPTGLGAFFDLFNSKTPVDNAVVSELSRLQQAGEGATPSKLTPQQTILKEKVKLTFDQLNQLEQGVGEALRPQLQELVTSPNYAQLTDEQKSQAIDKIVQTTRSKYKNINAGAITGNEAQKPIEGQLIPIVNKNGNVTMIDTSFQPTKPTLTGLAELDKKAISKYNSEITQKVNDVYDLFLAGKLSANDANTQIARLKGTTIKSGKKTPRPTFKTRRLPKLKALKVKKAKKIKAPKIKPIKFLKAK